MFKIKYKIIFIITCLSIFYTSCDKTLDISPTHSLSEEKAFQNMQDVEDGLAGVYAGMRSGNYYGGHMAVLPDMMTDNLTESTESLANFRLMTDWLYLSDNGTISGMWITMYGIIADANNLLDQVARFETAENTAQAARIKGQLLAIRGLVHFDLLRCFANDFDRNSNELGVAIVTRSSLKDPFAQPARQTVKQCYDLIIKDLEDGLGLVKKTDKPINSKTDRSKIDDTGINAILARVNLYAKKYDDAIRYASDVIKARPLADDFDFPFMWTDNGVEEVAWALYFGTGEGGRLAANVFSQGTNRAQFDMSPELVNLFGKTKSERDADIRWSSYVTPELANLANQPRTGRFVATKYNKKSTTTTPDGIVNFKAFRTGEMYLIRAEAYALSNKENEALKDMNTLRFTRNIDFQDGTEKGAALLDAIATERRKELWLEGHRWFDLKRTTRTISRKNCDLPATACDLKTDDIHWNFPIPLSEMLANKNMQQNKGY